MLFSVIPQNMLSKKDLAAQVNFFFFLNHFSIPQPKCSILNGTDIFLT